jgi:cell division protein FtsB
MQMQPQSNAEGLQLSTIIQLAKSYAWELVRFSWLIIIIAALLGGYLYYSKLKVPTQYMGKYTLTLNETSGTDNSYLQQVLGGGLLAGLGSGPGSELSAGGGSQIAMLQELLHTRKILKLTLFEKVAITYPDEEIKNDFLINHYIDLMGIREAWIENESPLVDFRFTHDKSEEFSRRENSVLLMICSRIANGNLTEELSRAGILSLNFKSIHEEFSFHFLHILFEKLNTYFTQQSIEKQERVFNAAKQRRDSLENVMNNAESGYIEYLNSHNVAARGHYAQTIETQYLARKLSGEMEAYFMAVQNTEAAKIALEQQRPLLQPIDKPIYPLGRDRPNEFLYLIIGVLAGGFLGTVLVLARKAARDFLKAQKVKQDQPQTPPTMPTA